MQQSVLTLGGAWFLGSGSGGSLELCPLNLLPEAYFLLLVFHLIPGKK